VYRTSRLALCPSRRGGPPAPAQEKEKPVASELPAIKSGLSFYPMLDLRSLADDALADGSGTAVRHRSQRRIPIGHRPFRSLLGTAFTWRIQHASKLQRRPLQVAPFFDLGKVFDSSVDLVGKGVLRGFHYSAGVGFRGVVPPSFVGRLDITAGGREGIGVTHGLDYPF